jgi:hypothetical protein
MADVTTNFIRLGKSIALVFGADFFTSAYPRNPIRYVITLAAFAALAALLLVAVRAFACRWEPAVRAYACYWASAALFISLAYWLTDVGAGGGPAGGLNYMLTLGPAAGVGVGLLAAGSLAGRIAVSLAIVAVGCVNIVGIANGRAQQYVNQEPVIRLLEQTGVTRGYASYWDAQNLTWKSGMRLLVVPVQPCGTPAGAELCRKPFSTISSWYDVRSGPSFLITDPPAGLGNNAPSTLGRPSKTYHLSPDIVVYLYPYDLAQYLRP